MPTGMNRKAFFNSTEHGTVEGNMVYHKPNDTVSGVWLHKNVFIEIHRRQGKSILPELMAKLREGDKK